MKTHKEMTMKKTAQKIFCCDCKYECDHYCNHPRNLRDDAYAPKHEHVKGTNYINQNNDCKWFRRYNANG